MAAEINLNDIAFQFTALINNMDISLNITRLNIDKVEVVSDTFGKLNALLIKTKLNNGFRLALPILNHVLANHQIKIPSNILGVFELSDLTLGYYDSYIFAGATPTFLPPSEHAQLFVQ